MSEMVYRANAKGNKALVVVHRKELVQQIKSTFMKRGARADVGMVQTVVNRLDRYEPDIIIIDEAHHSVAKTYQKIIDHYPDAYVIGLTATPYRLNKKGFTDIYDDLVLGKSVEWLIEEKRLAKYKYKSADLINHDVLKKSRGDYTKSSIDESLEVGGRSIFGDVLEQYQRYADGLKTIIYCHSVESSRKTAERFHESGYKAHHLDGKSTTEERIEVVEKFRSGEIEILTNAELFGEGFDIPDCYCVILLRPTQSLSLFIQQTMRAMRYVPNKQAMIIDLVGNWKTHGLPDMDIDWKDHFLGVDKKQNQVSAKECPSCFSVIPTGLKECPHCGESLEVEGKGGGSDFVVVKTDLREITKQDVIKLNFKKPEDCKSVEELYELAKDNGYKPGWAYIQAKRLGMLR